MKSHLKLAGPVLMAVTVVVGLGAALWPHAFTAAAFGLDLAPHPSEAMNPSAWVATALVRIAGVLVAAFGAMVVSTWIPRRTGRWLFGIVGGVAIAVAIGQWIAVLPFSVGLGVTVLCVTLILGGEAALLSSDLPGKAEI